MAHTSPFPCPIDELPKDPIYGLLDRFHSSSVKNKLNLSIGIVPDFDAPHLPFLFPSVKKSYDAICNTKRPDFSYNSLQGRLKLQEYVAHLMSLPNKSYASIQSVGGTGALTTLGTLYKRHGLDRIAFGIPSWINHHKIFQNIGFSISNWNWSTPHGTIDKEAFLNSIQTFKSSSPLVFLFHLSCHNPTGIDPSHEEWDFLLETIQKISPKSHILFDTAYLGFQGLSLENEIYPLQKAYQLQIPFSISFSAAKSLGLYSERIGIAYYVGQKEHVAAVESHMCQIQRVVYSSAPKMGAQIAEKVLETEGPLLNMWKKEIQLLGKKLKSIRRDLFECMIRENIPIRESFKNGSGLFAILHFLSPNMIQRLQKEDAIFMTEDGRINIAALSNPSIQERFISSLKKNL